MTLLICPSPRFLPAAVWPTNFVRQHLQQQVVQQAAMVAGFPEYLQRHAVDALLMCLDDPPQSHSHLPGVEMRAHEFDRLGFLLQAADGG